MTFSIGTFFQVDETNLYMKQPALKPISYITCFKDS